MKMVMGNEYWRNMKEGTVGFLKTLHKGEIPERFYELAGQHPKAVTHLECGLTSAP
jgi:hypothetical protein